MPQIPYLGLFLALVASPLLMAFFKRLRFNQFSPIPRISLWVAAGVVLAIAAENIDAWRVPFGLAWPTWRDAGLAILASAILFLTLGVYQYLQARYKFFVVSPKQVELQRNLLRLPFSHRCFVVVTAAVTEEVLYRGYAIGVGQHLLGSIWTACILSVAVFTLAHFRWGLVQIIPVFLCTLVITLVFAFTQNLLACIIVHAILDGAGVLVGPAIMARRHSAPVTG